MDSLIDGIQRAVFQSFNQAAISNDCPVDVNQVSVGMRPQASIGIDVVVMNKSSQRTQAVGYTLHTFDFSILCFATRADQATVLADYLVETVAQGTTQFEGMHHKCVGSSLFYTDQDDYVVDIAFEVKYVDRSTALGGTWTDVGTDQVGPGGVGTATTNIVPVFAVQDISGALTAVGGAYYANGTSTTVDITDIKFINSDGDVLPNAYIASIGFEWRAFSGTGYTFSSMSAPNTTFDANNIYIDFSGVTFNSDDSPEYNSSGPPSWDDINYVLCEMSVVNIEGDQGVLEYIQILIDAQPL